MLYVFNKSKIYSYMIALCTVILLFVAATTLNGIESNSENIVETGANIVKSNQIENLMVNE